MDLIVTLIERRANLVKDMRGLLEERAVDGVFAAAEDDAHYSRINEEVTALSARIDELTELDAMNKRFDEQRARFEPAVRPSVTSSVESDDARFRRVVMSQRSFEANLGSVRAEFNPARNVVELRDLGSYSDSAGGDTIPTSFNRRLYEHLIENSAVRQTNVNVITTTDGAPFDFPKTLTHGTAVKIVGEGTAIEEGDPTFDKVTFGAWKYAGLIQVPVELVQDTAVDLIGYIARDLGRQLGNKSGTDYVTGNGTNKPNGIMTAAGTGVNGTVASGVSFDELISLQYSVIEPYASNAFWLMRRATEGYIRKLKDSNGQYVWQPSVQVGVPNQILGRPVVTDPNVAALGSAAKSIAFGDFRAYTIRDVAGVRLERSDDFAFDKDLVTWKAALRTDGDMIDLTGAIKVYAGTAA